MLGTDLEPCGIGRGLLRNLLKLVDGFFCFLVGVLIAALSKDWRRLGDMAARTVVVRATERVVGTPSRGVGESPSEEWRSRSTARERDR